MIKKIRGSYVMNRVWVPMVVRQALTGADRLTWRITDAGDCTRHICGNCGQNERPDVVRVMASPAGKEKPAYWICDECVKKEAPDLYEELLKVRWLQQAKPA